MTVESNVCLPETMKAQPQRGFMEIVLAAMLVGTSDIEKKGSMCNGMEQY